MFERDDYEKDPSYGTVSFTRGSYNGNGIELFGSSIKHNNVITLRINKAYLRREFNKNWIGDDHTVVEVVMSQNQFAELITSMNIGRGIPCTINYIKGEGHIEYKGIVEEGERFKAELKEHSKTIQKDSVELLKKMRNSLTKPNVTKTDLKSLTHEVEKLISNLAGNNLEFIETQFERAMDKKLTEIKAEAEAFITNKLTGLGVKAFNEHIEKKLLDIDEIKKITE